MQIKRFEITGLFGKQEAIAADLNSDINIITGRNGAGKTTVLKLLWYIVSGNILLALQEVPFSRCRVVTNMYNCTVHRFNASTCKVEFETEDGSSIFEDIRDSDDDVIINAEDEANAVLRELGGSLFLPTFRRIEGGFTLTSKRWSNRLHRVASGSNIARQRSDIEDALADLARRLSNKGHRFVASISTVDIVTLLLTHYANYSQESNDLQQRTSSEIISTIKDYKIDKEIQQKTFFDTPDRLLDFIRSKIEQMEIARSKIMAPMDAVRVTVEHLIKHTGITIDTRLSFGDAANTVNSELLSAGEKQMLSFICYNAFYKNSVILIDEPELSLHVDWQRLLFPTLLGQASSNQFIVATHSPFIYSKYPDKEIQIDLDRGDSEVDLGI